MVFGWEDKRGVRMGRFLGVIMMVIVMPASARW